MSETAVAAAYQTEDRLRDLLGEDRLSELRGQLKLIVEEAGQSER